MAVHLKRRNKQFEVVKKVIKPEGFRDALEARQLAISRRSALSRLELDGVVVEKPRHRTLGFRTTDQLGGETPEESGDVLPEPMEIDRVESGAAERSQEKIEEPFNKQREKEHRRLMKQRILDERKAELIRQRVEKIALRERERAEAEAFRKSRLKELEDERAQQLIQAQVLQDELLELQKDIADMNEKKAVLVSQLKQVLHVDDSTKVRIMTAQPTDAVHIPLLREENTSNMMS